MSNKSGTDDTKPATAAMQIQTLTQQLQKANSENEQIREELQRIYAFANNRNVEIYSRAYTSAIEAGHAEPGKTATKCLEDLRKAFGMENQS